MLTEAHDINAAMKGRRLLCIGSLYMSLCLVHGLHMY